jgi:hypothetical protein
MANKEKKLINENKKKLVDSKAGITKANESNSIIIKKEDKYNYKINLFSGQNEQEDTDWRWLYIRTTGRKAKT